MLEKNGLGPVAEILENYGIDSETDLLVFDQDDFSKLSSRGMKLLYTKKLDFWCEGVRERVENMLTSSLNTPAGSVLLISEELNVVTCRCPSIKKQGARQYDVKPGTLKKCLLQFPDQFLQEQGGQLYCVSCCTNVGSSKSDVV